MLEAPSPTDDAGARSRRLRDGDAAVGWVSLGPREDYERLASSQVLAPVDDTPVWSIVCFVVARRRAARASRDALLAAAIDVCAGATARRRSRPTRSTRSGERIPSANAYQGTLAMFERAGFEVVARRQGERRDSRLDRPIVRLRRSDRARPRATRPYVICRGADIVVRPG